MRSLALTAREACAGYRQCSELQVCGHSVFWLAEDPDTGVTGLWQSGPEGTRRLETGPGSVRSCLNGYGGGAYAVLPHALCWVAENQVLWSLDRVTGQRRQLVNEPGTTWGGLVADPARNRWLVIREHGGRQALVAIEHTGRIRVLHAGLDFYSAPAVSTDGCRLAWVSWSLPDMPWSHSVLFAAAVNDNGDLHQVQSLAPPAAASVQQPCFQNGRLWVLSDHQGWWQPWQVTLTDEGGNWQPVDAPDQDHANAPWQLAERHSCPLAEGGWARVCYRHGIGELWLVRGGAWHRLADGYTDFRSLAVRGNSILCIARSSDCTDTIIELCPDSGRIHRLYGGEVPLPVPAMVQPESVTLAAGYSHKFPVQAFFYAPRAERRPPPLILIAHGGPTSAAYATYNPQAQFWCQQGFAVAEVNYCGSTGFGRDFRQALAGRWGRAEVTDMLRVAEHFVSRGRAEGASVFIQGRSSGGYTALMAAITGGHRLAGLASLFGVTDPMNLRAATHRFESGYLDWLLGDPGPAGKNWQNRTPARLADQIGCPAIFFQGGQDRIVVPEQTRAMVAALHTAGRQASLHWFRNEGHGLASPSARVSVLGALRDFYTAQLGHRGLE